MSGDLGQTRAALFRELSEASVLPPDDPVRQDVEARVARGGSWMRETWLSLLEEGEQWRLELARADAPPELEAMLLAIPKHNGPLASMARGARRRPLALAAAAVILVAATVAIVTRLGHPPSQDLASRDRPLQEVALLAINDHLDTHELEIEATERRALERALTAELPFKVEIPDLGRGFALEGGRRCTLGTHPVAFTAWRAPHGRLTLIHLRAADFGLPQDMAARVVRPDGQAARARPLDVLLFGQGDSAWVLVADAAVDLQPVIEKRTSRED